MDKSLHLLGATFLARSAENLPTVMRGMEGTLGRCLEARAERSERSKKEDHPPPNTHAVLNWSTGLGVYCFGPAELGCSLRTKCCYHLLVLSGSTGTW